MSSKLLIEIYCHLKHENLECFRFSLLVLVVLVLDVLVLVVLVEEVVLVLVEAIKSLLMRKKKSRSY